MKKLILFFYAMLLNVCYASIPHIYALHINGIDTTREEARNNLNHLEQVSSINSNMVTFDVVWNPTGDDVGKGFWSNLSDLMNQKAKEHQASMTLDDFTHYWISANNLPDYAESSTEYQQLKSQITSRYTEQLNQSSGVNFQTIIDEVHGIVPTQFDSAVSLLKSDYVPHPMASSYNTMAINNKAINAKPLDFRLFDKLSNIQKLNNVAVTQNYLNTKNLVFLLPHSQGNLYANGLYSYLTSIEHFPPKQIAIYGIATPANANLGSWISDYYKWWGSLDPDAKQKMGNVDSYITSSNDFVIDGARLLFNQYPSNVILPSNLTASFSSSDYRGHSLIDIYLNDSTTMLQIQKMMMMELDFLANFIFTNGEMGGRSEAMKHFGISFAADDNNSTDGGIATTNNIICQYGICDNNILYFNVNYGVIHKPTLYFPNDYFKNNTYYLLRDINHTGINIELPKSTNTININCNYYIVSKLECYENTKINDYVQDSADPFIAENWETIKTLYPIYFISNMFTVAQFTINNESGIL